MSSLSQFSSGGVKRVQRGTTEVTSTTTVTISAVDTNKSVVIATVATGNARYTLNDAWWGTTASVALTNSTTLTLVNGYGGANSYGPASVAWQVVEYY